MSRPQCLKIVPRAAADQPRSSGSAVAGLARCTLKSPLSLRRRGCGGRSCTGPHGRSPPVGGKPRKAGTVRSHGSSNRGTRARMTSRPPASRQNQARSVLWSDGSVAKSRQTGALSAHHFRKLLRWASAPLPAGPDGGRHRSRSTSWICRDWLKADLPCTLGGVTAVAQRGHAC